jgi:deoxyribodipyrimidine photolyase-related protein
MKANQKSSQSQPHPPSLLLVLGDQLFDPTTALAAIRKEESIQFAFMAESDELCTHFRYHKKKLVFFLSAMRAHAHALKEAGIPVHYEALTIESKAGKEGDFLQRLLAVLKKRGLSRIVSFEVEDHFFAKALTDFCTTHSFEWVQYPSPMFLTSREQFANYIKSQKKPFMKTFYERQRKRLSILVDSNGEPTGGAWSFDSENRKRLPEGIKAPPVPTFQPSSLSQPGVIELINDRFKNHPGDTEHLWCPHTREDALRWLQSFLDQRLHDFGDYEDAFSKEQSFLFHSVLTPFLNTGLLTPQEVVEKALTHAKKHKTPLNSLEGFIRQVIGWREFIRGIYHQYDERQSTSNFWRHERKLKNAWYSGETGIPPLDETIRKANQLGYVHHIERLMVLSNLMLLSEVHPHDAHRWFMEMVIDSADWVMGPNVYGMGLFSDGGVFATKPYICGSNYLLKMGPWKKGDWCQTVDGLYWRFIDKHISFFRSNPRLSMMSKLLEKMPKEKRNALFHAAETFIDRTTHR